jgi:hypothetical protein
MSAAAQSDEDLPVSELLIREVGRGMFDTARGGRSPFLWAVYVGYVLLVQWIVVGIFHDPTLS